MDVVSEVGSRSRKSEVRHWSFVIHSSFRFRHSGFPALRRFVASISPLPASGGVGMVRRFMAYLLIVEDDVDSRDVLCRWLEAAGHETQCVPNGEEALTSILSRRPDLIVLDLFMPQMDGPSLLEILRSYLRLQSVPVIVITGVSDGPHIERVRRLNVQAILTKGQTGYPELLEVVAEQLQRSASE